MLDPDRRNRIGALLLLGTLALAMACSPNGQKEAQKAAGEYERAAQTACGTIIQYAYAYENNLGGLGLEAGLDVIHAWEAFRKAPMPPDAPDIRQAFDAIDSDIGGRLLDLADVKSLSEDCDDLYQTIDDYKAQLGSPQP